MRAVATSHGAIAPWLDIWLTASTAWVRELTPSARSTAATWSFTVSTERLSSRAISLFDWPRSSRPSTSVWRGVSLTEASASAQRCRGRPAGRASRRRRAADRGGGRRAGAVARHRRHVDAARHHHAAAPRSASRCWRAWARSPSRRGRSRGSRRRCGRRPRPRPPGSPASRCAARPARRSRRHRRGAGRAAPGRSCGRRRAPRAPRARPATPTTVTSLPMPWITLCSAVRISGWSSISSTFMAIAAQV